MTICTSENQSSLSWNTDGPCFGIVKCRWKSYHQESNCKRGWDNSYICVWAGFIAITEIIRSKTEWAKLLKEGKNGEAKELCAYWCVLSFWALSGTLYSYTGSLAVSLVGKGGHHGEEGRLETWLAHTCTVKSSLISMSPHFSSVNKPTSNKRT